MNPTAVLFGRDPTADSMRIAKDREGMAGNTIASGWVSFFFQLTETNTLAVLVFWNILHFIYAGLWGGFLMFAVVEDGLMFNFTQAFNPVYFIMQGLVLNSLYGDFQVGTGFYTFLTELRSLSIKFSAVHEGNLMAMKVRYQEGGTTYKKRVEQARLSVKLIRDMLMVYTYCTFKVFGVQNDTDYENYKIGYALEMARDVLIPTEMNGEEITNTMQGAHYYLQRELTMLHRLDYISGADIAMFVDNLNTVVSGTNKIWVGMKPWKSPILEKLPSLYLIIYKYLLVPLGTFSTVGPVWGIIVYGSLLFIYNSAAIVVSWLGNPFSNNANHVPISFSDIRRQLYAIIATLLDKGDDKYVDDMADKDVLVCCEPTETKHAQ